MASKAKNTENPEKDLDVTPADVDGADQAPAPVSERVLVRLREPFELYKNGIRYGLKAGDRLSSRDYDLDKMYERGAQMDVLEADKRTVLCDYSDIAG